MNRKNKESSNSNYENKGFDKFIKSVHGIFTRSAQSDFGLTLIQKKLGVKAHFNLCEATKSVLNQLVASGKILKNSDGTYRLNIDKGRLTGTLEITSRGYGYVILEDERGDIFIPERNLSNANNGDIVEISVIKVRTGGKYEGRIERVVKRSKTSFIGTLKLMNDYAFVIPDIESTNFDIYIPKNDINDAKNGDKVLAEVTEWSDKPGKSPMGKVVSLLGKPGLSDTEMKSIAVEFGFDVDFPAEVLAESEAISDLISNEEIALRRDFRKVATVTIDPKTAKDFDDAISFQVLPNGNFEVGVHIADVTHYLKEGTALDNEAQKRATSVYLVDRVIPMLPERLSNFLCSLRPNKDKLCYSAVFELDSEANIVQEWFGKTIIHSIRRYAYEEVQEILLGADDKHKPMITDLNRIAKQIRAIREKSGAISFETMEFYFKFDENGNPLGILPRAHDDSHELIEDFMLLANMRVATFLQNYKNGKFKQGFVYRVHDEPDMDKLVLLKDFAGKFGYKILLNSKENITKSINDMLHHLDDKPEQNMLQQMAIRTMAKAKYTTKNLGHYGLGFGFYTHFTSPIRRYPDVLAHRLLHQYINTEQPITDLQVLEQQCVHSSTQERNATSAEPATVQYMQLVMLKNKIGSQFEGVITGLKDYGFYVELKFNYCEGLVRFSSINHDYLYYDERSFSIRSKSRGTAINFGDTVVVKLIKINLKLRQADFMFVSA